MVSTKNSRWFARGNSGSLIRHCDYRSGYTSPWW